MILNRFAKKQWKFQGGLKLSGFKSISNTKPITVLPVPQQLIIPLKQHIGEPARPVVCIGDRVYKGQIIAESSSYICAPVHASSSGTIAAIEKRAIPHASLIKETCIVIHTDGKDEWLPELQIAPEPTSLSSEEIRQRIREAGIVGLSGAVFPSAVKLKPAQKIDTLIINGVECEPYITCDDVLMRNHAEEVVRGALLLAQIVKPLEIVFAIEDNKPQAYRKVLTAIKSLNKNGLNTVPTISVKKVKTIFPAGGEKQLIKVLTGNEVPPDSLPYEVGVICLNVGTTAAIFDALYNGSPLISRITTVTGEAVGSPANYRVLLGTPIDYILDYLSINRREQIDVILGGPMMGVAIADQSAPITKAANCLLVKNSQLIRQLPQSMPCIRCGQCAAVCPMKLVPQQLYWHARGKSFEKLSRYHLESCIECGCCEVVCPGKIPLVHYFRFAKSEIKASERDRKKADVARIRTESRQRRLEHQKQEQEERKARRKAMRKKAKPEKFDSEPSTQDSSYPSAGNSEKKDVTFSETSSESIPSDKQQKRVDQ